MTIIAGVVADGRVYLAADSFSAEGARRVRQTEPKVWRDGPCVVGVSGSLRLAQIVRYHMSFADLSGGALAWLLREYIPLLKTVTAELGGLEKDDETTYLGGDILIGYRDVMFWIDSECSVVPIATAYTAIGSGAPYALGALWGGDWVGNDTPARTRLTQAVKAAQFFDVYCGGEVVMVATDPVLEERS
jgi:ATP-dependent protease HslVU (ClpYQ) peptidase subunit